MSSELFIGIDCSTTAVKAIAWDLEGKAVSGSRVPLDILTPQPDFFEQDPDQWAQAVSQTLRIVSSHIDSSRVKALCISHQRETFLPVGRDNAPLSPAILWLDQRARSLMPELQKKINPSRFHQRTGKPLTVNLAPPKIEWLRRNRQDIITRCTRWMDTHTFLVHYLTGEFSTSIASVDPLGLFDLSTGGWDQEVLDELEISLEMLPAVSPPGVILGALRPAIAMETGLPLRTPVVAGLGDGQSTALGTGLLTGGEYSLSLGTSVIGGLFSKSFHTGTTFRTMSGPWNTYVLETVLLSGTQVLNWIVKNLLGQEDNEKGIRELELKAASVPPGSDGLFLVPYWSGVMNPYWDSDASGIMVGLRGHHTAAHIYRAALEGISFEIRLHLEGIQSATKIVVPEIVLSGGGSRSMIWPQIIADVTGLIVSRQPEIENSSLGAAILAAQATGAFNKPEDAVTSMTGRKIDIYHPNDGTRKYYEPLFNHKYRNIYPVLKNTMSDTPFF